MPIRKLIMAFSAPLIVAVACCAKAALGQSGSLLKGAVQKQDMLAPAGSGEQFGGQSPGLTRKDMRSGGQCGTDPFDTGGSAQGETSASFPLAATQTALVQPELPFKPVQQNGIPQNLEQSSQKQSPRSNHPTWPARVEATVSPTNDPDSSPEMQLQWDAWHKRVAGAIFQRFDYFAHSAFKYSHPLMCRIRYVVTRDGHIRDLTVVQHSTNSLFDLLVEQCVKSLDSDTQLLQFPTDSQRQSVEKFGTFTQNYGIEGFKYTTGDRETVRGR